MENAPTSAPNSTLSLSASRSLSSSLAISTKSFTTTGEKIVPGPHLPTQANSAPSSDVDWIGVVRTTYGNWIEHPRPTFHNLIHQCAGTNQPPYPVQSRIRPWSAIIPHPETSGGPTHGATRHLAPKQKRKRHARKEICRLHIDHTSG